MGLMDHGVISSTIMLWQLRELLFSPPVDQKQQGSSDRARTWLCFDTSIYLLARDSIDVVGFAQVV